jgi:hypothetical protein
MATEHPESPPGTPGVVQIVRGSRAGDSTPTSDFLISFGGKTGSVGTLSRSGLQPRRLEQLAHEDAYIEGCNGSSGARNDGTAEPRDPKREALEGGSSLVTACRGWCAFRRQSRREARKSADPTLHPARLPSSLAAARRRTTLGEAVLNQDVLPFHQTQLSKSLPEGFEEMGGHQ